MRIEVGTSVMQVNGVGASTATAWGIDISGPDELLLCVCFSGDNTSCSGVYSANYPPIADIVIVNALLDPSDFWRRVADNGTLTQSDIAISIHQALGSQSATFTGTTVGNNSAVSQHTMALVSFRLVPDNLPTLSDLKAVNVSSTGVQWTIDASY